MSDFQELPGAAPLKDRAASIPGHVERIMLRDYSPVNEGFHILYDAAELLRRNAARIAELEEALKPFAELWLPSDEDQRETNPFIRRNENQATYGDLRRARKVIHDIR